MPLIKTNDANAATATSVRSCHKAICINTSPDNIQTRQG